MMTSTIPPTTVGNPLRVDAVAVALMSTWNGATVDVHGMRYRGDGILVALPGHGMIVPESTPSRMARVRRWVATVAPTVTAPGASPARYFGSWVDSSGATHLDVVEAWSSAEETEAVAAAITRGERAVHHAGRRETLDVTEVLSSSHVSTAVQATRAVVGSTAHLFSSFHIVGTSQLAAVADAYRALPEYDHHAETAWNAFGLETLAQWQTLQREGFTMSVHDTDPYASAADMFDDVSRRHIKVLSTAATGGHPFLPDHVNDVFRAVHDVLGHAATGRGFDRHGEEAAYQAHAVAYSPLARQALTTETRGQNATMITDGGTFPVQKVAILPAWCAAPAALTPAPHQRRAALADAVIRHVAGGLGLIR